MNRGSATLRPDFRCLRQVNDTKFDLSSAVFTRDEARGLRFAQLLQAGMTLINDMPGVDRANMPFGGEKNSGQWVSDRWKKQFRSFRAGEVVVVWG
jgi:acyl-CoA reductase-like NAD-dependent aldehyde dehydrogenase